MSLEWANLVSLDSIQHEQSYFEVGLGVQLSLDWNGTEKHSWKVMNHPTRST